MQKNDAAHKHIALTVPPWIMTDSAAVWDTIAPLGEERRWEAKKVLYTFGDAADEIAVIARGLVKIVAADWNGNLRSIGILGPGSVLGEAAFFHKQAYRHMICCVEPCVARFFTRQTVLTHIMAERTDIMLLLFQNLAQKSYMMSTQLECVSFLSSEQIIALFLYHLGVEQQKQSWIYSKLAARSFVTIGELLGMHRVTVTKIMNAFRREGLVDIDHGRLRIENLSALEQLVLRKA